MFLFFLMLSRIRFEDAQHTRALRTLPLTAFHRHTENGVASERVRATGLGQICHYCSNCTNSPHCKVRMDIFQAPDWLRVCVSVSVSVLSTILVHIMHMTVM